MTVLRQAPDSQFAYVVVVARRARQLMIGGRPLVDNPRSRKTSRIAEEELLQRPPRIRIARARRRGREGPAQVAAQAARVQSG